MLIDTLGAKFGQLFIPKQSFKVRIVLLVKGDSVSVKLGNVKEIMFDILNMYFAKKWTVKTSLFKYYEVI